MRSWVSLSLRLSVELHSTRSAEDEYPTRFVDPSLRRAPSDRAVNGKSELRHLAAASSSCEGLTLVQLGRQRRRTVTFSGGRRIIRRRGRQQRSADILGSSDGGSHEPITGPVTSFVSSSFAFHVSAACRSVEAEARWFSNPHLPNSLRICIECDLQRVMKDLLQSSPRFLFRFGQSACPSFSERRTAGRTPFEAAATDSARKIREPSY